MFGLADYEDEEDIPINFGGNGKDGGEMFDKKSGSLLASIRLTDPIWSNLEDATVAKRKFPPPPDLDRNDAVVLKRQKSGKGQTTERSNDGSNSTCIDGSGGSAPSETSAQVLESAGSTGNCSQAHIPLRVPLPLRGAKVRNGIIIHQQTFDSDVHPVTKPNHVDRGDSWSNVGAATAGNALCSNGNPPGWQQLLHPAGVVEF